MRSARAARGRWAIVFALALLSSFLGPATPVLADTGVPMIVLVWPLAWLLLIPIVLVEAAVARRLLGVTVWRSIQVAGAANLASTLIGIPLTWVLLVLLEISVGSVVNALAPRSAAYWVQVALSAPWLFHTNPSQLWVIPAAALVLCVPFHFSSVWIEYRVARRFFPRDLDASVKGWSRTANALSYSIVIVLLSIVLIEYLLGILT